MFIILYRHFLHRQKDYKKDIYYLLREGYDKNYRDDFYDNGYLHKYRNSFDNGYHGI